MANVHGVSTGRITKPKPKGGARSAFQGSGRRIDGSVVEAKKKAVSVDMEGDYEKGGVMTEVDIEMDIEMEDDNDWNGEPVKKRKQKYQKTTKPRNEKNKDPKESKKHTAKSKSSEAALFEKVVKQVYPQPYEEMEIVSSSGDIEVVRRIDIRLESARFALLVLVEERVTPGDKDEQSVSTAVKRTVFPCANGIFIRYDPSNKMRLREMPEAEFQRRGQRNPCSCDACKDAEEVRKKAEMEEQEERKRMEMAMMADKSTRSGKSFNTQGRVLGD